MRRRFWNRWTKVTISLIAVLSVLSVLVVLRVNHVERSRELMLMEPTAQGDIVSLRKAMPLDQPLWRRVITSPSETLEFDTPDFFRGPRGEPGLPASRVIQVSRALLVRLANLAVPAAQETRALRVGRGGT